jgi:hypothetical protein
MIKDNLKDIDFIKDNLSDRLWRLQNLYHIKDKDGNKVVFKMNDVQKKLHESLWYRNVIPKARKTGVSTFFSILTLDQILFSENKTGGIIAHRQEDVKRLFRNNILFAVEHMHPWLKHLIGDPDISSANEIMFKNGGTIFVSLTTRGMTPQFLHVSEYGYICKNSPDKAEEIISGAMNSVALGNMVSFESTAMGRGGRFYEMCMQAEQARITGRQLTPLDFRIHFFPWWIDPQYALHDADFVTIPEDMMVYFRALKDKHGISLTLPQMRWYVKSYNTNGSIMKTEFPSCLSECFEVSLEGAYYASQVTAIYAENRIGFFPVEQSQPVHTAWDLGMDDATAIVFYQTLGHEIRIVDYYEASGVGLDEHVKELHKRGYRYGRHTLPHDVNVRELNTGSSRLEMLYSLGVHNIDVAPKLTRADGIEKVRLLLPRTTFDKGKTQKLLDSLQAYRKKWDDTKGGWSDTPAHGPESHGADATRYLATTYMESYNYTPDHGTVGISKDGVHIESVWK